MGAGGGRDRGPLTGGRRSASQLEAPLVGLTPGVDVNGSLPAPSDTVLLAWLETPLSDWVPRDLSTRLLSLGRFVFTLKRNQHG